LVDTSRIVTRKDVLATKIKDDQAKLLLEAKTIIENIASTFNFINPSSIAVPTIQIGRLY
ncbi:hypothetical protein J3Q64DRAFT_1638488, partial [Phycomyces blakesleeanus]